MSPLAVHLSVHLLFKKLIKGSETKIVLSLFSLLQREIKKEKRREGGERERERPTGLLELRLLQPKAGIFNVFEVVV